jgi:hypothetical protein
MPAIYAREKTVAADTTPRKELEIIVRLEAFTADDAGRTAANPETIHRLIETITIFEPTGGKDPVYRPTARAVNKVRYFDANTDRADAIDAAVTAWPQLLDDADQLLEKLTAK